MPQSPRTPKTAEQYLAAILAELRRLNEQAIGIEISVNAVETAIGSMASTARDARGARGARSGG